MKSENLIQNWINENKAEGISAEELITELVFVSYPYEKYGCTVFAMKSGGIMNVPLIENLSKDLHNGSLRGYNDTKEFAEYLGERMVLALHYFKGKTNEEIKKILEGKDNGL